MEKQEMEKMEKQEMTNQEYLASLAGELMGDTEWEFPQQTRFFLVADLEWTLLGL